jgi:phage tail-like protein
MLLATINTKRLISAYLCILTAGWILFSAAFPAVAQNRDDPLISFNFGLECEGRITGYFTSVSGLGSESEVVEHKVVDKSGNEVIRKIPGRLHWLDITLKRGITSNLEIWQWRQQVNDGNVDEARKNCSILAFDKAGQAVARWNFINAWPMKVSGPIADASGDIMVEELVLVHEGLEREQ